jgi:hypothetical protein
MIKRILKRIYHRTYWIQDHTPDFSVWFSRPNNRLVEVDYKGCCGDTARVKRWKDVNPILMNMKEYGCKKVCVSRVEIIFGHRYITDYEYDFSIQKENNE